MLEFALWVPNYAGIHTLGGQLLGFYVDNYLVIVQLVRIIYNLWRITHDEYSHETGTIGYGGFYSPNYIISPVLINT